ncbi:Protein CBR-NID-1 [Caenorhabditis briggsae]|uniref:Protein CBR-NID-1 n=1 Tax=Caenorhabditis briggsae TaxID=6238 RepID=A8X8Y5_CAEBR|nr:Protein CBR-NID-1 [Caenorhabditis briggsae]CAP29096.2 Protein CBR-NID-1 [Caenorhabditis briggsae]
MKHKKVLILLLLSLLLETRGDGTQEFYPFGQPAGDTRLKYSLDQSAVALKTPLIFLQKPIDEIFLSHNGIIGLGKPVPEKNEILAKIPTPAIAVFYSPVANGKIDYRVTSDDQGLLAKLTQDVKQAFTDAVDFHGLQAVVITWSDIQNAEQDGPASFQIAIVTDGISTYCINHYGALPWSSSMGYYAQTGFVRSVQMSRNFLRKIHLNNLGAKNDFRLSNNQFGNSFIFRISGNSIEDPKDDGTDEYDYNNYDQEYEGEQPADCPKDKFVDNCPAECRTVRDERGCERCICAERPNAPPVPQEPRPELENTVDDDDDEEEQVDGTRYQEPTREQEQQPQPQHNQHHQQSAGQTAQKMSCSQRDDKSCHANSVCQDLEGGFCCTCDTGYYGNGKECLPKGEPQRISGSFEGVINRIPIDKTELHTFATSTDGNVHTAVSKIPSDLGHPLLFLYSIGGVMGWLFADVQSPNVYNGFQLTGGLFNRTVAIHVGQNNYVTLKQEFSGRNIHDYFKSHLFVSGTLPDIAPGSEVIFPDYEEEYVRERRGYLTSRAAFDVIIRDGGNTQTYRMSVEQQITFEECPFKEFDRDHSMKLHVKRINVVYNADEGVVRYGAKNFATRSTSPASNSAPSGGHFDRRQHGQSQLASERPIEIPYNNEAISSDSVCAPGRHQCTLPNMKCRVVDPSYRCECEPGYQATHDASSHIGWICQDLDECQRGDHNCDQHAKCTNRPGAFSCQCLPGYQGDGRSCIREQHAGHHEHHQHQQQSQHSGVGATSEGLCTAHNQCHQWGECVFTSEHPTGRCKCRGWYVGDGVNHCGPPEENKPKHNAHIPQNRGQACGSYVCDVNAECMPEPSGGSECVCKAGFSGNGITCESLLEDRHAHSSHNRHEQQQQTGSLGKVCRSHEECSEHGSCAYHHNLGYYQCACTEPYVGNGVDCTLPGSSASASDLGCDVTRDCSEFADCVYERSSTGATFRCVCQSGYTGDGKYCMQSQLAISALSPAGQYPSFPQLQSQPSVQSIASCDPNCGADAQCVYDEHNKQYRCECYTEFVGDGFNCVPLAKPNMVPAEPKTCVESSDCHSNGHCVIDENGAGEYICKCLPGFRGDGFLNCRGADQCNPSNPNACHQNAHCAYDEVLTAHACKCVDGFKGDGVNCVPYAPATNCNLEPRICHANAQCVMHHTTGAYECICKPGSSGDGYKSCDVMDTPRCTNCSVHAYCAQNQMTGAYQCKCNAGYNGNGYVCVSMSSCLDDRSLCDSNADCVPGEGGHYVCNCHYGYHGDGKTCSPDSSSRTDKLLVARGMAIFKRSTNPDEYGKQLIVIPHHIPVGIDYDCQTEKIVWSDMSGHSIRTASMNGTDHKSFFSKELSSPEGIAVDWSSRNVYYADSMNDEIGVASLNGKFKKSLVTEGLVNPRSVVLDLYGRHLYYSDWHRENPYIGRVDMDGKNNRVFLNEDIHLPNGLTILPKRRELCWVDAGNHRLSCVQFNGANRRTVFSSLQYPFGLTHDQEQKFYWTDWKDNRIHSVGVYGEGYRSFQISLGGSGKVFGILAVPKSCLGPNTPCSENNGGCEHLCLPGQNGAVCECPDNVKVKGC